MGLPTLSRGEVRPGSLLLRGRHRGHCSSPISSRRSCQRRQAQPNSVYPEIGGFLWGLGRAPDVPMDTSIITDVDCCAYVAALERNGFFRPDSWYMNAASNIEYPKQARDGGKLSLPVLFLHGTYDFVCETTTNSRFADPMRKACSNLTEVYIKSGHWMAQEQPVAVNRALTRFIAESYRNCSASSSGHDQAACRMARAMGVLRDRDAVGTTSAGARPCSRSAGRAPAAGRTR